MRLDPIPRLRIMRYAHRLKDPQKPETPRCTEAQASYSGEGEVQSAWGQSVQGPQAQAYRCPGASVPMPR